MLLILYATKGIMTQQFKDRAENAIRTNTALKTAIANIVLEDEHEYWRAHRGELEAEARAALREDFAGAEWLRIFLGVIPEALETFLRSQERLSLNERIWILGNAQRKAQADYMLDEIDLRREEQRLITQAKDNPILPLNTHLDWRRHMSSPNWGDGDGRSTVQFDRGIDGLQLIAVLEYLVRHVTLVTGFATDLDALRIFIDKTPDRSIRDKTRLKFEWDFNKVGVLVRPGNYVALSKIFNIVWNYISTAPDAPIIQQHIVRELFGNIGRCQITTVSTLLGEAAALIPERDRDQLINDDIRKFEIQEDFKKIDRDSPFSRLIASQDYGDLIACLEDLRGAGHGYRGIEADIRALQQCEAFIADHARGHTIPSQQFKEILQRYFAQCIVLAKRNLAGNPFANALDELEAIPTLEEKQFAMANFEQAFAERADDDAYLLALNINPGDPGYAPPVTNAMVRDAIRNGRGDIYSVAHKNLRLNIERRYRYLLQKRPIVIRTTAECHALLIAWIQELFEPTDEMNEFGRPINCRAHLREWLAKPEIAIPTPDQIRNQIATNPFSNLWIVKNDIGDSQLQMHDILSYVAKRTADQRKQMLLYIGFEGDICRGGLLKRATINLQNLPEFHRDH